MVETLEAPVVRVELFEDRAAITREVTLPRSGRNRFRIGPITPLVSERGVSFPGGTGTVVEDVRTSRRRQTRRDADPDELETLDAAAEAARDRRSEQADATRRARGALARSKRMVEAARGATPKVLQGQDAPVAWMTSLRSLAEGVAAATTSLAEAEIELSRRSEEAARLDADLEGARRGRPVVQGFLELSVLADAAGTFLVRYVVPCALWRPAHRAELNTMARGADADQVSWELRAICWNATGEDWTGVPLSCSTARPGDLAEAPTLEDDPVELTARNEMVVEARDEEVQLAREPGARAAAEVPGVDDGGEPRTYEADGPVDLPSDGRPVSIPLDRWQSGTTVRWQAFPERSSQVVLRTTQPNGANRPILAGPVELVRDGEGIGRGTVPLVPPGEPFSLGWGSHDGIRIVRRREHEVERSKITGRQTHTFRVELKISHLGADPCSIEIRERIPVSEIADVSVSAPESMPPSAPDDDGFCRWHLDLTPGDRDQIEITYIVRAGARVQLPFQGP